MALDLMEIGSRQPIPPIFFLLLPDPLKVMQVEKVRLFSPVESEKTRGASLEAKANLGTD